MTFFDSEIVRAEMAEISELQEDVYSNVMKFHYMNDEDKCYHINLLDKLIDKQKILYARLSLSDDPEAIKMKEQLQQSVQMLGFPAGTNMQVLFDGMKSTIESFKQRID